MSKWISVKEKLPDEACDLIVAFDESGYVMAGSFNKLRNQFFSEVDYLDLDPTHWMQFPKPPEKES